MAEIENGYYYIEDGVVLREDGYTDSVDKVGKVVGFDYEQEIRNNTIEEFLTEILKKYTAEEGKQNYRHLTVNIKNDIAEIAESMKGEKE